MYGRHTFEVGRELFRKDYPFYSLIQAAMRKADTQNEAKLRALWPDVWEELKARYNAPGGVLKTDADYSGFPDGSEYLTEAPPTPDGECCASGCCEVCKPGSYDGNAYVTGRE